MGFECFPKVQVELTPENVSYVIPCPPQIKGEFSDRIRNSFCRHRRK
jgi:hypothetical protein